MNSVLDLSWGCPFVVRQALTEVIGHDFVMANIYLERMSYTPHYGAPRLIEQLKDLSERQSGHRPKHLFVTCGATGGINAALYALKTQRTEWVITDNRYYPIYPAIVELSDMIMISNSVKSKLLQDGPSANFISLAASPSAPDGLVCPFSPVDIWDAAYASRTYGKGCSAPSRWKIMVGSLSKTLGLAGLRLGWASTDDDFIANSLGKYISTTYIGLSSASMAIAEQVFENLDQDTFELRSSGYIDSNREEVQKILTKFGQGDVPVRGMFATLQLGKSEKKSLEKANIKWQPGSTWGEDDSWARLSLGQSREITRLAVRSVIK